MVSLAAQLDALPAPIPNRLRRVAREAGGRAWLVGGAVRDLLIDRPAGDIGVVVEGDAPDLAHRLPATVERTTAFGTAVVRWDDVSLWDLVTARSETYDHPADLPTTRPADLEADLRRRDFTLNALAASLADDTWGEVVDPTGGLDDLAEGKIRILHPDSFIDDPTRCFRAVRYHVRLKFDVEPDTGGLLLAAVENGLIDRLTPDRLRHELEKSLADYYGRGQLAGLGRYNLVPAIHPWLRFDNRAARANEAALSHLLPTLTEDADPAVWFVRLLSLVPGEGAGETVEALIERLALDRRLAEGGRDFVDLLGRDLPAEPPSAVVETLDGTAVESLLALAARVKARRETVGRYLLEWRHVRPALDGDDLQTIGVAPGPSLGKLLRRLRHARLDGAAVTAEEERDLVAAWRATADRPDEGP